MVLRAADDEVQMVAVTLTALPADEGSLRCIRYSLPHSDGFGVAWVCGALLLVVAPVLVSFEEVSFAHWLPTQRRVNTVFGEAAAQLHQAVGVTRLSRHLLKDPVLVTWKTRGDATQHFNNQYMHNTWAEEAPDIATFPNDTCKHNFNIVFFSSVLTCPGSTGGN